MPHSSLAAACGLYFVATEADRLILQNPPLPSHIVTHPELARTFEEVATHGKDGFYKGRIAEGE